MKIEHVALWVNDLEHMRRFYETYLGQRRTTSIRTNGNSSNPIS